MKKILLSIIFANLALGLVQFVISNAHSSRGVQLSILESRLTQLTKENNLLSGVISEKTNLSFIESQAKTLGLVLIPNKTLQPAAMAKK